MLGPAGFPGGRLATYSCCRSQGERRRCAPEAGLGHEVITLPSVAFLPRLTSIALPIG